ncbi:hypothetical protein FNB79_12130 [Formosa sediminum]|uniref:Uncharacterized protein n=1 Tax=Formosa sediminum TaxID=2594004 RepID=A0A516GT40_9FLAO|nr:DUF3592 domain-containing protein [Formosa sediminum]QDO94675.1 hypothetical protein FNB79_12130 [Formosa sediminum]
MKNIKVLWIILLIITFILFYYLIPLEIYNKSPFIIAGIGGVIFTILLAQAIFNFKNWNDYVVKTKYSGIKKYKYTPLLILPGLVMYFVFFINFSYQKKGNIKESGHKVTGEIIDLTSFQRLKGGGSSSLTIKFSTKEGKELIVDQNVNDISNYYKGQNIELMYSKENPEMINIIPTVKIDYDEIKINEIISLLSVSDKNIHLKKINPEWKKTENNTWVKGQRDRIQITEKNEIACVISDDLIKTYRKELADLNFINMNIEDKGGRELFETSNHRVILNQKTQGIFVVTIVIVVEK